MEFILIDKFLIWQLEEKFYSDSSFDLGLEIDEALEGVESTCGIEYHGIKEYEINKKLNIEDYYLYRIVDREKFIFAVMKYNLNYLFVDPKLQS
jgi:hypothetical protein